MLALCGGCGLFTIRNFCWSDGSVCPDITQLPIPPGVINAKWSSGGGSAGCTATTALLRSSENHERERLRLVYVDFLKNNGWTVTDTHDSILGEPQVGLAKPKEGLAIHVYGGEPYEGYTEGTVFGKRNRLVNPDLVDALQVDITYDPRWDGCADRNLPK
jgi:hypothetical protein